jgi:hypothetical protein
MLWGFDLSTPQGALEFANYAHRDQVDKIGVPYVYHVARVGASLWRFGDEFVMAGFLHDVVEDTDYSLEDLTAMYAPDSVVSAVRSVTKHVSESDLTAYEASIRRAMCDPIGKFVKAADVSDNASRVCDIPWGFLQSQLRAKYEMAERVIAEFVPGYRVGVSLTPPTGGLTLV